MHATCSHCKQSDVLLTYVCEYATIRDVDDSTFYAHVTTYVCALCRKHTQRETYPRQCDHASSYRYE